MRSVLERIDLGPYVLIAPCGGAYGAIRSAATDSGLISGLAIVQAPSWAEERRRIDRIDPGGLISRPLLGQAICAAAPGRLSDRWFRAALGPEAEIDAIQATSRGVLRSGGCSCLASTIQANRDAELELDAVSQPTLIVWGTQDRNTATPTGARPSPARPTPATSSSRTPGTAPTSSRASASAGWPWSWSRPPGRKDDRFAGWRRWARSRPGCVGLQAVRETATLAVRATWGDCMRSGRLKRRWCALIATIAALALPGVAAAEVLGPDLSAAPDGFVNCTSACTVVGYEGAVGGLTSTVAPVQVTEAGTVTEVAVRANQAGVPIELVQLSLTGEPEEFRFDAFQPLGETQSLAHLLHSSSDSGGRGHGPGRPRRPAGARLRIRLLQHPGGERGRAIRLDAENGERGRDPAQPGTRKTAGGEDHGRRGGRRLAAGAGGAGVHPASRRRRRKRPMSPSSRRTAARLASVRRRRST